MKFEKGTSFSRYRLLSKIGEGGMGEVYLAEDTKLDRKVALKILPAEFAEDKDRMSRFVREAKAVSALNHPNIITIHEIDEFIGVHFIATEYIEGKTLAEYARSEPLKCNSALDIAIQVASALDEAHAAGIVHRDIKPDNVMIRATGLVKILDFGIAKLTEKAGRDIESEDATAIRVNTTPGMIIGTANYMSPEQAEGKAVDARSDIFSFGVVLYEMFSGRLPFTGDTPMAIIGSILKDEPAPMDNTVISPELEKIISKSLRKDRDERYQTIKDVLIDLKDVKKELEFQNKLEKTVQPDREESKTRMMQAETADRQRQNTIRRNDSISIRRASFRKAIVGVIAILIIAAFGFGYWFFAGSNSKQIESIAVMPLVNEGGNKDVEYLADGMTETLISRLSNIRDLSVKARSTVFYFRDKKMSPKQLGEALNVQAVLLGRVVQRGDGLKISLELVDTTSQNVLWSDQFERKMSNLVMLQSEIAKNVSENLKVRLTATDAQKIGKTYTTNAEAQRLYLEGRFYWNKRTVKDLEKAIELFKKAIEIDPDFALAYSGLADTYALYPAYNGSRPKDSMPLARKAAEKAIELDGNLAEAHASLGLFLAIFDYDFDRAYKEYDKAIKLNPKYPITYMWYAGRLSKSGKHSEAIEKIRTGLELDPFSMIMNANYGDVLRNSGRYDEAVAQFKKTIAMDPGFGSAHLRLSETYIAKGSYKNAVEELVKYLDSGGDPESAKNVAAVFAEKGWNGLQRFLLGNLLRNERESKYQNNFAISEIYARLGNKDKTIVYLNKSLEERELSLLDIKIDPAFDFLREDVRFESLLERMGLNGE